MRSWTWTTTDPVRGCVAVTVFGENPECVTSITYGGVALALDSPQGQEMQAHLREVIDG